MNTEKLTELINKEIDGLISREEKGQLSNMLKDGPHAKKIYVDMMKTKELLKDQPLLNPSENLKKNILNSINANLYKSNAGKYLIIKSHKARITFAYAVGVVCGLILFYVIAPNVSDHHLKQNEISGTIGTHDISDYKLIKQIPFQDRKSESNIQVLQKENEYAVTLNVSSVDQFSVQLHYDADKTKLKNVSSPNFENLIMSNKTNLLEISLHGKNSITFNFTKIIAENSQITLDLFKDNLLVHSEKVVLTN